MENKEMNELTNDELLELYKSVKDYIEELNQEIQKVNEDEQ